MISSFKQKDGKVGVLLWGTLTKDPSITTTKSGVPMAWFYVKYGMEQKKNPTDKAEWKTIKVNAFDSVVQFCAGLEAKDPVFICGELKENNFNEQKGYVVNAEIVLSPNAQLIGLAAYDSITKMQKSGGSPSGANDETHTEASFEDITTDDIDDIFPGL